MVRIRDQIDARFVKLKRDIANKDKNVLGSFLHVRMAGAMVKNKAFDECGVGGRPVTHRQDFDHVQVNRETWPADGQHGINTHIRDLNWWWWWWW